jgi:anaerobic glycerol-3-phosphate dehydrogenase
MMGRGPDTYVFVSGLVGGVAGFTRVEQRLVQAGRRVVIIDPYQLSLDSADVSFDALARRTEAAQVVRLLLGSAATPAGREGPR